ncbi:hypothetical protein K9L05_01105 [Candidatus Babeliales bacterium]|nr:hypothetical protein [Candidatus Babeliales bacterium]
MKFAKFLKYSLLAIFIFMSQTKVMAMYFEEEEFFPHEETEEETQRIIFDLINPSTQQKIVNLWAKINTSETLENVKQKIIQRVKEFVNLDIASINIKFQDRNIEENNPNWESMKGKFVVETKTLLFRQNSTAQPIPQQRNSETNDKISEVFKIAESIRNKAKRLSEILEESGQI